ncbi:uncharacterized protein SOCE26_050080 [Sorangium cellulosum]|uniref:Uncharacterized protein n=1 Tax=Sorangium cellulosum TaxID=56 RepID=A0A2L0EW74_SORCE|nr:uncharacterized protein SOCE26_050080 [Sorangium cellulosum]
MMAGVVEQTSSPSTSMLDARDWATSEAARQYPSKLPLGFRKSGAERGAAAWTEVRSRQTGVEGAARIDAIAGLFPAEIRTKRRDAGRSLDESLKDARRAW